MDELQFEELQKSNQQAQDRSPYDPNADPQQFLQDVTDVGYGLESLTTLLDPWVDELAGRSAGAMRDVLLQLKLRPCFEEQWTDQYQAGLSRGKARVLQLEQIRTQSVTMTDILGTRPDVLE